MPCIFQHICQFPSFTHQAYRYGIALSCLGVLLNWLGIAQSYIRPIRYLGVGLVIVGSLLIIVAMFRWMFITPPQNPITEHIPTTDVGDLHVITVPMGRSQGPPRMTTICRGKPPDYRLVAEKPPTYEEAMSMLPPYAPLHPTQSLTRSREYLGPHIPDTPGSEEDYNSVSSRLSGSRLDFTDRTTIPRLENGDVDRMSVINTPSPINSNMWEATGDTINVPTPTSIDERIPTSPPPLYCSNPSIYSTPTRGDIVDNESCNSSLINVNSNLIEEGSSSSKMDKSKDRKDIKNVKEEEEILLKSSNSDGCLLVIQNKDNNDKETDSPKKKDQEPK